MIFNTIREIAEHINISEPVAAKLLANKIIPNISTGSNNRKYFYTTDDLIEYAYNRICLFTQKTYSSMKEAFLEKDIDRSIFSVPNKCEVLTITNQKGGVGKTTSAANIGAVLSMLGKRVLLVDMDSQAQSSRYFNKITFKGKSILNLFEQYRHTGKVEKSDVEKIIYTAEFEECKIDVLPSEIKLARMLELMRMVTMPYTALDAILSTVKDSYDVIICDTAPTAGLPLEMAVYSSDRILLATQASEFSLEGLEATIEEIKEFIRITKKDLRIDGIIINSYVRTKKDQEESYGKILDILVDLDLDEKNLITNPESTLISKSQSACLPILEYKAEPKSAMGLCNDYFKYAINLITKGLR